MRQRFFLVCLSVLLNKLAFAQSQVKLSKSFAVPISTELKPFYELSEGQMEDLLKGDVISEGKVDSPTEKEQQMMLFVSGINQRNCTRVMRKLSQYENYNKYMDFVKQSSYDEKTQKISFTIDHALLPFPMLLGFKIPRITKEGHYPFIFEDGFLKGLTGKVIVKDVGKFCLLGLKSDWRGPKSPLPNMVFSTFVQTVGKIGLEKLIRISSY